MVLKRRLKATPDDAIPQQKGPDGEPKTPQLGISRLWWIILIGLMVWNVITYFKAAPPKVEIPYSTLIDQVKAGNISTVTIKANQITGTFIKSLSWPQVTQGPTPTDGSGAVTPQSYSEFVALFPDSVGDPNLLALLEEKNVEVQVENASTPWFITLLTDGLPLFLLFLAAAWMGRQAMRSQQGIFSFGQTRARKVQPDQPKVTFEDVAGADEAKRDLQEAVDFLRHPQKYYDIGARIPRGVLLVGPPGTGKTLLARAVTGEAEVPFFSLSASEFVEMFVGVGARRVRNLFQQAKQSSPAIVFIDELDAVGRRRGGGLGAVNDEREQTLNQLLVEMDGFDEHHEVIVLAATNRPDVLHPALLRPGRFDRQVVVAPPDRKGRLGILKIHTRELRLAGDVKLDVLAGVTAGMSGADLANLCNEAALLAARLGHITIQMTDFETADIPNAAASLIEIARVWQNATRGGQDDLVKIDFQEIRYDFERTQIVLFGPSQWSAEQLLFGEPKRLVTFVPVESWVSSKVLKPNEEKPHDYSWQECKPHNCKRRKEE